MKKNNIHIKTGNDGEVLRIVKNHVKNTLRIMIIKHTYIKTIMTGKILFTLRNMKKTIPLALKPS